MPGNKTNKTVFDTLFNAFSCLIVAFMQNINLFSNCLFGCSIFNIDNNIADYYNQKERKKEQERLLNNSQHQPAEPYVSSKLIIFSILIIFLVLVILFSAFMYYVFPEIGMVLFSHCDFPIYGWDGSFLGYKVYNFK